jgi:hypothetical protein
MISSAGTHSLMSTGETILSPPAGSGKGLMSRSFLGLLITQFLGAMNDNMFRWLVIPIGMGALGEAPL